MQDFIFGTLADDVTRIKHQRALWRGITHRQARSPLAPAPNQPVVVELTLGPEQAFDQAWVYWSTDGLDPIGSGGKAQHGSVTEMQLVETDWNVVEWGYQRRYRATIPGQPAGTVVRYFISVTAPGKSEQLADDGKYYAWYVSDAPPPIWSRSAVVYQIFVDRFYPGEGRNWQKPSSPRGFYGGTIRGITEKLHYIQHLGANVLWLSPIFPSPSHHGYDATDFFSIEPRLGTKEDLRQLLDSAHQRGMRVLLDFVPNHWSNLHPNFQEAIANQDSPYVDWYTFRTWPDDYATFFGVKTLPQINLRYPAARQHVLDAAAHWLEFGVDGYRVDYALGPTPDFWADFRRVTLEARPDCWTFGEVVEPSDSQRNFHGLLNGCLDFMLLEAIRQTFTFHEWDTDRFLSFLDRHEAYFPPDFSRPSFLDNHDMNRYLWAAQGDKVSLKLAALCQFSLIGQPVIYYGTEVGLSQERDVRQGGRGLLEEARLPMLWQQDQDLDLLAFYRKLIATRLQEPTLQYGTRRSLAAPRGVIAYERQLDNHSLVTMLNLEPEPCRMILAGGWETIAVSTDPGCNIDVSNGEVHIELPAKSGMILR
jgi:glycosidase